MAFEQVRHKLVSAATEDDKRLEILDFESMSCTFHVAKTKALISVAVYAKLICTFVFAYTDCWFSHDADQVVG